MTRAVILDQSEWDALPARLAAALTRQATDGPGRFRVVVDDGDTSRVLRGDLVVWLCGTLVLAFQDIMREQP